MFGSLSDIQNDSMCQMFCCSFRLTIFLLKICYQLTMISDRVCSSNLSVKLCLSKHQFVFHFDDDPISLFRPLSPYLMFFKDIQPSVRERNPGVSWQIQY